MFIAVVVVVGVILITFTISQLRKRHTYHRDVAAAHAREQEVIYSPTITSITMHAVAGGV